VEILRPVIVHGIVFAAALKRHAVARSALKKASMSDGAARVTWAGAAVNLLLACFKLFAGVYGRSAAMVADAGHSFSDLISDGLTLLALRMSSLPPDVDHPYGHGRFESVGSLAIATLLLGAGVSFGASSYAALLQPAAAPLGKIALWAAVASIVSKEALYRATFAVGRSLNSQILIANAWHHRSDALSSVVALAGIGGSLLGWTMLDPLAGMLVAGLVSWMGLRIGVDALGQLTDTSDYSIVHAVGDMAGRVEGVQSVGRVRCRSMGGSSLVDLEITVDPMLSASCGHRIAEEVRWSVSAEVDDVSEVLVHVDTAPHDVTCPLQDRTVRQFRPPYEVEGQVRSSLLQQPQICAVPRVQVHYLAEGLTVDAYCAMAGDLRASESRRVAEDATARLLAAAADIRHVRIGLALTGGDEGGEGSAVQSVQAPPMPTATGAAGLAAV